MGPIVEDTPEPPPSGSIHLDRDIHFALRAESLQWHTRTTRPTRLCWPIYSYLRMLGIPMGILSLFALSQLLPGPYYLRIAGYVVVTAVLVVPLALRGRRQKRESERLMHGFPEMSDQRYRLRVTGPPAKLEELRAAMQIETHEFEPRIIRVGRAKRPGLRDAAVIAFLFLLFVIPAMLAEDFFHIHAPMLGMVLVYAAITLTFLVWSFLWPTYLRIVPGRLDILNYNILGGGKGGKAGGRPTVRSFDLRTARILVMIPGSAVLLLPGNSSPSILDVGPLLDPDPLTFERALLAAAKSSAPTPPLPDDELLG